MRSGQLGQLLRQRARGSVDVVVQTIGVPRSVTPVAPAGVQKAPGCTTALLDPAPLPAGCDPPPPEESPPEESPPDE